MSLVTQRSGQLTEGERTLLRYTAPERAVLCDRICHIFQVIASSMMLEYPLTSAVLNIVALQNNLLRKVFQFRTLQGFFDSDAEWHTMEEKDLCSDVCVCTCDWASGRRAAGIREGDRRTVRGS